MYKMLIVDDENTERECIRYLIEESGLALELKEAPDAPEALQILKEWPADILFTDVQMPVMTGLELARQTREFLPDIKTIIFSSYAEFEYARAAMTLGAENYILKPVVPKELETTLNKVIRELDEANFSRLRQDRQQTFLLQYALQGCINGNYKPSESDQDISGQLQSFSQLILLDFPAPFLEQNYTAFYEGLRSSMHLDMETLSLSPTQALLFLRQEHADAYGFAVRLHAYITDSFQTECYLSVSRPLREHSGLQDAYAFVEQQMEQRFWNPEVKIFSYDHAAAQPQSQEKLDDDSLLAAVKRSLSAKDAAGLQKNLELLFQKYRMPSNQSQIFVKFIFSNLITTMYPFLPAGPDGTQADFKPLETLITELYIQPDILEIIAAVQSMAEKIIKSYESTGTGVRREILSVQNYISRNYQGDLSVEMLASLVYLTPDYLSRLFKKSTGKSLSQYIRQVRMEKASELLCTTNRKVIDIGIDVGYPNYSYFCQSFREYFGKSPEKYRQEESHETFA